ncbi:thermopsin family protease [Thermoplasma sp. Kam2015]|uniref:thermopsin family protease n=1 Tax=Thermoplasma sp. Kam2015 TaxID=2094122 RepID=UPI001F1602DD|nr:thermopsin family protease [Thermoplasma sp. Kam2015]
MMNQRRIFLLTVIVAVIAVTGFLGVNFAFNDASNISTHRIASSPGKTEPVKQLPTSMLKPVNNYLYLPAKYHRFLYQNGTVEPLYTQSPAPMGIGFFGLENMSGTLIGNNYYASSFEAVIDINNLSVFNLADDAPSSLTFQLNTVTANTTLFGNSSYTFWTQNVATYSVRTHEISFVDNIWNFSSPGAEVTSNAILNSTGTIYPYPGVHIALGPTFYLPTPFTLLLYMNTSEIDGNNVFYFNYSIPTIGVSGTYDRVTFNSTYGMPPAYKAPPSYFRVSGTQLNPAGLLYDAEIMMGGPGGGSTTTFTDINGMMQLKYISATNPMHPPAPPPPPSPPGKPAVPKSYANVPNAFDFGTDTGETSVGAAVAWNSQDQAILSTGPSLLYGMWNVSSAKVMDHFTGDVSPSNAFLFISPGNVVNYSQAGYVPLTASGSYSFWLPAGEYAALALLSDHRAQAQMLSSSNTFVLPLDMSAGLYTPLMAVNNNQIRNISMSGDGSVSDPYVLFNNEYGYISPLFGEINDYSYPQFAGVMLMNTSAYVMASSMPTLPVLYQGIFQEYALFEGMIPYNYLGYWIFQSSHFILRDSQITGWFTAYDSGEPLANVVFWNTSDSLISSNVFMSMDSSALIYGGSNNTVWGNYFVNSPKLANAELEQAWNLWGEPLGLAVYSSNNTIYNNFFSTEITAISPSISIYSGNPAMYTNMWNITVQPATNVHMFDGQILTGSIVGGNYQGGNFWYNFNGTVPYNDDGMIEYGGDYEPLNLIDLKPANSVTLNGNVPYLMTSPYFQRYLLNLGPVNPDDVINVTLYLNLTNLSELEQFVSAVNSPMSPYFHDYLTPQEFMAHYYPSESQIMQVEAYYSNMGFKVWSYSYAPLVIVLHGTVGMFERVFGTVLFNYEFTYPGGSGAVFMTNTANPYIPAQFSGLIMHVYGLSYSSEALLSVKNRQEVKTEISNTALVPTSGINGSSSLLTPVHLAEFYNVTGLENMGFTGHGIKIGILGVGESANMSAISMFWDEYGIHNPQVVFVNLTPNGKNPYPEGVEADLDVEWSGAMAPNATIYDVMQPFNLTGIGDNAINLEIYYMLNVIHPQIISGSWAELQFHHDAGFAQIYNLIGLQAAAEGTTIFLGSADSHSIYYLTVMASEYIVSVGGVYPVLNQSGYIVGQYAWYQPEFSWYGGPVGSGGGNSFFFARPTYQSSELIVVPSTFTNRGQPDIAMPAAKMVFAFKHYFGVAGGTSFATPISAGIFADIESAFVYADGSVGYFGWIQPALYDLGYGNEFGLPAYYMVDYVQPYPNMVGSGYLGQGWNDFVGIGSFNAFNMTVDLANYYLDTLLIAYGL